MYIYSVCVCAKPNFELGFYPLIILFGSGQSQFGLSELELNQFLNHEYGAQMAA